MIFDVKQAVIDRLRATKRENIEDVIDYMVNNQFFTVACGSHHKYRGGLTSHAWQTYQIALRLNAAYCAEHPHARMINEDSIAIAALLHDVCKCTGLKEIRGHGRRSVKILEKLGLQLTDDEFLAVRFHMSLKGKKSHSLYDEAMKSRLRCLVHKADVISFKQYKGYKDPGAND